MMNFRQFDCVVPIWRHNDIKALEQIGSGVLVSLGRLPFMLTVSHITDELDSSDHIFMPATDGFRSIAGAIIRRRLPPTGLRSDDVNDIAICKLYTTTADKVHPKAYFLPEEDCNFSTTANIKQLFTFAGYPWRRTTRDAIGKGIKTEFSTFTGASVTESEYLHLGYNKQDHIVMQFRRNKSFRYPTLTRETALMPHGISGGGVFSWNAGIATSTEPPSLHLCGICMAYHPKENLMVGIRLNRFIELIRKEIDFLTNAP